MLLFGGWLILMLFIGYVLGTMKRDCQLWKLCNSQQERGDYWFDKYMKVVREDWEPLTKDFHE